MNGGCNVLIACDGTQGLFATGQLQFHITPELNGEMSKRPETARKMPEKS
jgi:hypothetical protein